MDRYEQPSSSKGRKGTTRSTNFSITENEALCKVWIYINEDPIVGVGQRVAHYWERIYENFKQRVEDNNKRTKDSIQSRFGAIQRACNRWVGIISSIERTGRSGTTIQNRLAEAKSTFVLTHSSHFQFEHCWVLLKDSPKWNEDLETRSSTTKKRVIPILDVDDEDVTLTPTSPSTNVGSAPIDPFLSQVGDGSGGGVASESGSGSGNKKKRPSGTKGKKEMMKRGGENYKMMELLREQMASVAADRACAVVDMAKLIEMKKWKEDNKILAQDTSTLEPEVAEYFNTLKMEIIQQRRESRMYGTSGGGGGASNGDGASNN